jgi:hypothetical protein
MNELFNTTDYTILQLATSGLGGVLWVVAYLIIIKDIRKYKFVEMPVFFACANIAWEFLWGFVFDDKINMGSFYVWAYRAWFFADLFIWISVIRYGYKQISLEPLKKYARPIFLVLTTAFFFILYAFISNELDNPMGAQTSYLLNFGISIVYITTWLRIGHEQKYSKAVAWMKMLGTLFYTIFFYERFPGSIYVLTIGPIIFLIDMIYISFLYNIIGKKT